MEYLAHIAPDGRQQTVEDHLKGTAELAAGFASQFGAEDHGRLVGLAHDIGKYSQEFQKRLHGGPKVDHATAGAIECAKLDCLWDACAVIGHHSGLPDFGNLNIDQSGDPTFCGRIKHGIAGGIPPYRNPLSLEKPGEGSADLLTLSYWIRMLYSSLVDADFLDTEAFMSGPRSRMYDALPVLLERLEAYIAPWWEPTNALNARRCEILKTCLEKGNRPRGVYTLMVPTGGGKTVASLAFALRHAVTHGMQRVIYVVPYTSIIEQNAAVFKRILGEQNVLEHHSGVVYDADEETSVLTKQKRLAAENWDAPVIVTTAVQFFESVYGNRSSKCRKLHNVANSVLIFDEAQMIPTVHLKPCIAAIGTLAARFQSTAVLCTATQPDLQDLFQRFSPELSVEELCPGLDLELFQRVHFQQLGKLSVERIGAELSLQPQILCIVNNRREAQQIFDLLPPEGRFHLSTLMVPAHRQETLAVIRQRLLNGEICRVVSTSLIEAGVDIDFPAVWRELAGLDSVLQAAGRCNREGRRRPGESIVTIFEGEDPAPPLLRIPIGACREALYGGAAPDAPDTIRHYFHSLRSLIGENTDKYGIISALEKGISGNMLPFETVAHRFHLIEDASRTVYIPLEAGEEPVQRILEGTASRMDYRAAGRYSVSVYEGHYQKLLSSGAIQPVDDENAVLRDLGLYSREKGLQL